MPLSTTGISNSPAIGISNSPAMYQAQVFLKNDIDTSSPASNEPSDSKETAYDVKITAMAKELDQKFNKEEAVLTQEYTTDTQALEAEFRHEKQRLEAEYRQKKDTLGISLYA